MRGTRLVAAAAVVLLPASRPNAAHAQGDTTSNRIYLLDFHIGHTAIVGGRGRHLVAENGAVGLAFAFEATRRSWGWVSFDFRPMTAMWEPTPTDFPPSVGMYAITAGASRRLGPAIGRSRWLPIEIGLGAGATRVEIGSNAIMTVDGLVTRYPADSESPLAAGLLSSVRWRPTAATRLRVTVPLGSSFRLGAGASLLATDVGDVRLWDGGWTDTGGAPRYRPTSQIWSFGTIVTAPITLTLSLKL